MKKLFSAVLFLWVLAAGAQEVTQQALQGKWTIAMVEQAGITVDFVQKKYTISEDIRKDFDEQYIASIEEMAKELLESSIVMEFKDADVIFTQSAGGQDNAVTGTFDIRKEEATMLDIVTAEAGGLLSFSASFKDGNLQLTVDGQGTMTLKKVN